MIITSAFEPAGEECGTGYDLSKVCPKCGAGRIQTTPLFLSVGRIPKSKDICRTIGEEIVVSQKLADAIKKAAITGVVLSPVFHAKNKKSTPDWFQLTILAQLVNVVPPTRFGIAPFEEDEKGECRCLPHIVGLNILSQVYIEGGGKISADVSATKQMVWKRMGLLVPSPLIIVSRKVYELFTQLKVKGCKFEVVQESNGHPLPLPRQ